MKNKLELNGFGLFVTDGVNIKKVTSSTLPDCDNKVTEKLTNAMKLIHSIYGTGINFRKYNVFADHKTNEPLLIPEKYFSKKEQKNLIATDEMGGGLIVFSTGLEKGLFISTTNIYYKATLADLKCASEEISA